jgi:hypothetical protein
MGGATGRKQFRRPSIYCLVIHMATKTTDSKGTKKIKKVMDEYKHASLTSSSGRKVTKRKQAVAIALSEARSAGAKIPRKTS